MAYPASTKTLRKWVEEVDQYATVLKSNAQLQHSVSQAGNLDMEQIRQFFNLLVQVNVLFTQAQSVPGIAAYLNAEKQGTVADPVAEFVAMRNAVTVTLDWLRTNVPQGSFGGTDYKLAYLFPANNTEVSSTLKFTSGQTAGYRTVLTTLIATVG